MANSTEQGSENHVEDTPPPLPGTASGGDVSAPEI